MTRDGDGYHVTGSVDALEVPETLHALIAARLDGLEPVERRLLDDASVLGKTFTLRGLAHVSGEDAEALEPILASLIRKEILALQADPFSPERGQYEFLHALVQRVAYDTLSRRERKVRHLAVAAYLEANSGPDDSEVVEVVAAHYLEAYRVAPDEGDATDIKAMARDRLTMRRRARSVAGGERGGRAVLRAMQPSWPTILLRGPTSSSARGSRPARVPASSVPRRCSSSRSRSSSPRERPIRPQGCPPAWGTSSIAATDSRRPISRMESAYGVLSTEEPDADFAALAAGLARAYRATGEIALAGERVELALQIAESLSLAETVAQALTTKALTMPDRPFEREGLVRQAVKIALENDHTAAALRAYGNLGHTLYTRDRIDEAISTQRDAVALARRRGDRHWEWFAVANLVEFLVAAGDWSEAVAIASDMPEEARHGALSFPTETLIWLHVERGDLDGGRGAWPAARRT